MNISISSWTKLREATLFAVVGITNTGVDFGVLNLLILLTRHDQGWWLLPFNGFSFCVAVINSYVLNGCFTFHNSKLRDFRKFLRFVAVCATGLLINTLVVWALSSPLDRVLPPIAAINVSKILATIFSLCWNYFAMRRWIFYPEQPMTKNDNSGDGFVPVVAVPCSYPVVTEHETKSAI